jgi:hypothetical protein
MSLTLGRFSIEIAVKEVTISALAVNTFTAKRNKEG